MISKKLVSIVCLLVFCMALTSMGQDTGTIRYEYWSGIGGTAVANLTASPDFPENPSGDALLDLFETPTNRDNNFGGRIIGWLHPDTTADYTFWIAADDGAELWLSTTDAADDAVLLCVETGWAGVRAWKDDESVSAPVALEAGQAYYIEALYKEGGGGDNLAVGWAMSPDINDVNVIDGAYLSPAPQQPNVLKARVVSPADGAVEVAVDAILEWTAGPTATSHNVYLSDDGTIDEADLIAETADTNAVPTLAPGMTYSWRVDEVDADGVHEGFVWTFTVISDQAHYPNPADADLWSLGIDTELSWTAGTGAMVHNVYFSTDKALVDDRDPSVATMFWMLPSLNPGELEMSTTYYWAVDEFSAAGTIAGPTWSFDVFSFAPIAITDESLVLQYGFDEIQGGLINDLSGNENYGLVAGDSPDIISIIDPDMGTTLSLPGGTNQHIAATQPTGIDGNDVRTISCWAKADSTTIPNWTLIFGFTGKEDGSGGTGSHFNIGSIGGPEGIGAHAWGWEETMIDDVNGLDWHHYAMTYDGIQIAYFLDGMAIDTDEGKSNVINLVTADRVHIGSRITQGSSFPGSVDDCRVYNRVLSEEEIVWAMNMLGDITGPNDMVQGVPNDGLMDGSDFGWPGGETPALSIDNDSSTKFLHFKGENEPTGIQVAPAAGTTVVTGLTLTTANDAPERDPITYEVYGSNESIDGPYELIASGDIVDFNQVDAYPRFTKNATAIVIDNEVAYGYYQVLFPTVRDADAANSMQIAEIELVGKAMMVYGFDDLPDGTDSPINGIHGGIDFGTDSWWGGDSWYGLTKCGYFYDNYVDVDMSFNLPANTHLVSLVISSDAPYSYTISDGVNEDIVGTTGTLTPEVINTNWTNGGATITINTEGGWYLVLDDITYIVN